MLQIDPDALAALEDNHTPSYVAQAFYGATLTLDDVPLSTDGNLTFTGDADPQGTGSVYVSQDGGDSLVPRKMTDPLAPFGQELAIARVVTVGPQSWQIPLGRFRIQEVPDMTEYFRRFPSQIQVVGWQAQLKLVDRFDIIDADDFLQPDSPVPGNSAWQEIQRLSPIPIVRTLTDTTVPASLSYSSRSGAITDLMALMGGVPHMTRQGSLTARVKDNWLTATTPVFTVNGTINVGRSMSNEVYNSVASRSSVGDNTILAVQEITDPANPLNVNGPLGRRTYTHDSPLITSQDQALADAQTLLTRLSTRQSQTVTVTCLPRPDIELGDYGKVVDPDSGTTVLGEVSSMNFSMNPNEAMTMDMIVAEIS